MAAIGVKVISEIGRRQVDNRCVPVLGTGGAGAPVRAVPAVHSDVQEKQASKHRTQ